MKIRLAVFASGSGTNAEQIATYFKGHPHIEVTAVFTNNPKAGVIDRMRKFFIPVYVFNRKECNETELLDNELVKLRVNYIILAGFLWLMPARLIKLYNNKIINIHPALLPKFGGKGMYGMNVHKAVIEASEKESGITIHRVTEEYDKGEILFQESVQISPIETPESLAEKIHHLEHEFFPKVIEQTILG